MENNNNLEEDVNIEFLNSPQLLYATLKEQANQVIMVADSSTNMINQHIPIECPNSSPSHVDDNVINIQLLYNPNAPTEPKLWDGSFHPISLYKSLEHLASNTKNIKDSLNFIAKYISNKNIDPKWSNKLQDFKDVGKVV